MAKFDKPYNSLPLLPPAKGKVETVAILKQESKAAVALAELKGLAKTLSNTSIMYKYCRFLYMISFSCTHHVHERNLTFYLIGT